MEAYEIFSALYVITLLIALVSAFVGCYSGAKWYFLGIIPLIVVMIVMACWTVWR